MTSLSVVHPGFADQLGERRGEDGLVAARGVLGCTLVSLLFWTVILALSVLGR